MMRWHHKSRWRIAAGILAWAAAGAAEVLVQYDFEGSNLAASAVQPGICAADFSYRGDGATAFVAGFPAGTGGLAWRATGWNVADRCFAFSVTIATGYLVRVESVSFAEQRSSTNGPAGWEVRFSRDGTQFHTLGAGPSAAGSWNERRAADTPLLDVTGTLYIRLHAGDAADGNATWRVDNVALNGAVAVDTGLRVIRYRGFDVPAEERWGATLQAGSGTIAATDAPRFTGANSLRLSGSSAADADPRVTFDAVDLSCVDAPLLQLAYAADGPDSADDLYLDLTYDNWVTTHSIKLVDGYNDAAVPFGATSAGNPATAAANPFVTNLPSVAAFAARVRFDERADTDNTSDHYHVDDLRLVGRPTPAASIAPLVRHAGAPAGITSSQATIRVHLCGGYPYPALTIYYGPVDGGTNPAAWHAAVALGTQTWGLVTHTLTGLAAGQLYYYRGHAGNVAGEAWADGATTFLTSVESLPAAGRLYLDNVSVGTNQPMSIDADGNGLSDRWEVAQLGTAGADPALHSDADGIPDGLEYLAGTDPRDSQSFMRIVSVDLASEASADVRVTVAGADAGPVSEYAGDAPGMRVFTLRAVDHDGSREKTACGSMGGSGSGLNTFTDSGAGCVPGSRYYEVAVSCGGKGYTNTEEWALHVQPRCDGHRYAVSVPVDLGSRDTLDGELGVMLARGLYAGGSTGVADRIFRVNGQGLWDCYYLLTNAAGQGVWWDARKQEPATAAFAAGEGFWVERRGGGPRTRTTAVFGGRSFTNTPVLAFTTNGAANGWAWTMFGWPGSSPLRQVNSGIGATPANQLGFAAAGVGGLTARAGHPHEKKGDQIFVWADSNRWEHAYWLIGGIGTNFDGRWWDDRTMRFADIALQPGRAYLYRHHVATNGAATGTNFWWQPPR